MSETDAFRDVRREAAREVNALTFDRALKVELTLLVERMVKAERDRCAEIVHQHQIAFASDACGWALDQIKDGMPAGFVRAARRYE